MRCHSVGCDMMDTPGVAIYRGQFLIFSTKLPYSPCSHSEITFRASSAANQVATPHFWLRRSTAGDQCRGGCCRGGSGCSVGLGGGLESSSHSGAHKSPSLYSPRVSTRASTSLGDKNPLPTGGITRSPIIASASDNVCWIQLPSAPLAMFSFATISLRASNTNPLPRTGCWRMESNCCWL